MDIPKEVSLKCLFCNLILDVEDNIAKNAKSGDQIKCNHCNEINDFDSMCKVAGEEIVKMKDLALQKEFDSIFK